MARLGVGRGAEGPGVCSSVVPNGTTYPQPARVLVEEGLAGDVGAWGVPGHVSFVRDPYAVFIYGSAPGAPAVFISLDISALAPPGLMDVFVGGNAGYCYVSSGWRGGVPPAARPGSIGHLLLW